MIFNVIQCTSSKDWPFSIAIYRICSMMFLFLAVEYFTSRPCLNGTSRSFFFSQSGNDQVPKWMCLYITCFCILNLDTTNMRRQNKHPFFLEYGTKILKQWMNISVLYGTRAPKMAGLTCFSLQ